MPKHYNKKTKDSKKKKRKTTSEDMPGSGMAKKAAQDIEKRQKKIDKMMKEIL